MQHLHIAQRELGRAVLISDGIFTARINSRLNGGASLASIADDNLTRRFIAQQMGAQDDALERHAIRIKRGRTSRLYFIEITGD